MTPWQKRADMVVHEADPFNAEPPPAVLAGEVITAVEAFYSRNHGPIPDLDPAAYRLEVDGLVERPLSLSLADLAGLEQHTLDATLQCAGNRRADLIDVRDIPGEDPWSVGATSTATWTGVRLAEVLERAGLAREAAFVAFSAPDVSQIPDPPEAYGGSLPREKALGPEVLLATGMSGDPLPTLHGGPLRVVVPGFVGARSVKWLQRITAQREPSDNYFQRTAYRLLTPEADPTTAGPGDGISLGPATLTSAILRPGDGASVAAGPVEVSGYAFAGGGRYVERVDVSADGGASWRLAELDHTSSPWVWRQWRCVVDVPPGPTEILARAWDDVGLVQPESPEPLWNPKGYGNSSWARITATGTEPGGAPVR